MIYYIEPKKKPLSSCLPVIIETDGEVELILGGSGGSRIISGVLQVCQKRRREENEYFNSIYY